MGAKGYVVVNVTVTDPERYPAYAKAAFDTVTRYGGRYLVRGAKAEIREGHPTPDRFVILEFPSLEQAKRWYDSEEYRPLKALRLSAARANGFLVQGV